MFRRKLIRRTIGIALVAIGAWLIFIPGSLPVAILFLLGGVGIELAGWQIERRQRSG